MNYLRIYNCLIEKRRQFPLSKTDQYCEQHHILPQSLGGKNDPTNLVNLTLKEHYLAHHLLTKIYKGTDVEYKMLLAFKMMSQTKQLPIHMYEKLKLIYSTSRKGYRCIHNIKTNKNTYIPQDQILPFGYTEGMYVSPEGKEKQRQSYKKSQTTTANIKRSNSLKQFYINHPEAKLQYVEQARKLGQSHRGKSLSDQHKAKTSKSLKEYCAMHPERNCTKEQLIARGFSAKGRHWKLSEETKLRQKLGKLKSCLNKRLLNILFLIIVSNTYEF